MKRWLAMGLIGLVALGAVVVPAVPVHRLRIGLAL